MRFTGAPAAAGRLLNHRTRPRPDLSAAFGMVAEVERWLGGKPVRVLNRSACRRRRH
jgi:hypothetical protein